MLLAPTVGWRVGGGEWGCRGPEATAGANGRSTVSSWASGRQWERGSEAAGGRASRPRVGGRLGPCLSQEAQESLGGRWPWGGEPEVAGPSCQLLGAGLLAPAAQHPQQFTGLQALLLCHRLHVEAHVHEELGHIHLLPRELVPDGRARGVAVGPGAAVHQVDGAALQWGFAGLMAVVEASVPAMKRPRQRGPLHLDVCPVAADRNPGGGHMGCGQSR